jgi:hypothetical protein
MSGGSVLWAEAPDVDREETAETEAHGDVDESFAARRLRRWLKGMFGGRPAAAEPGAEGARPRSGPVEGDPGEPGGSPGENQ